MIEQLFGSKTRVKLLQLFYSNPNRSFYVREITRKIDEQINSVRRELSNLLNVGIISSENTNNKLYYEVNKSFQYYEPLSQIFGDPQAVSDGDVTEGTSTAGLKSLGNVQLALYTGQFTRDERSGVDFVIVGDINQTQLNKYVSELEKKEGKSIRYAVMSEDEFTYRRQINDRFLAGVIDSKKQIVVDRLNLLTEKRQPGLVDDVVASDSTEVKAQAKSTKPRTTKK
jgi:hypothetical protein